MDNFYLEKFIEIQQQNVILSNKLRELYEDPNLRNYIEMQLGHEFFNILEKTPA